jgi:hypothetical protein
VVRPAIAVLADRPAELGHRDDRDVLHPFVHVPVESAQGGTEVAKQVLQLREFVDVGVPAAHIGESDLQADVRFDQTRDLLHRLTEPGLGVNSAV